MEITIGAMRAIGRRRGGQARAAIEIMADHIELLEARLAEVEAERDAARRDLARIVRLCGWDCDGNDPEIPSGAIHLYADAVQAVRELVEERAEDSREIVKLRDLCSRASGMIDTVDGAAYILSERLRVAGGD